MSDLTQKQEAFCLAYLETGNAAEAYRRSYDVEPKSHDSWIYVEACQLLDNPKVALRLDELREEAKRLAIYNAQVALEEYEAARLLAMDEKNPSAATSAVAGKVRLFGLDKPTKKTLTHQGPDGGPIEVTSARDIIASELARISANDGAAKDTSETQ